MAAWFLLDTAHADYDGLIAACRTAHGAAAPGCELSITLNLDGSRALVKVAGVGKQWLVSGAVLDRANEQDHSRFVELLTDQIGGGASWAEIDGGGPSAAHSREIDGGLA